MWKNLWREWKNLWRDECGAILSAELILILTILVIGLIVGLTSLRNAVVTELADVAAAIGSLNQSYSFSGWASCTAAGNATAGSSYTDQRDLCDGQRSATGEQGIQVVAPTPES